MTQEYVIFLSRVNDEGRLESMAIPKEMGCEWVFTNNLREVAEEYKDWAVTGCCKIPMNGQYVTWSYGNRIEHD